MDFKGSKTEKNVLTAFAGESQARNKYTFFAMKAREEGYEQIAAIFEETANQEKEHARRLFGFLEGGEVTLDAGFPAGVVGDTAANLEGAANGENYEVETMYPEFAAIADEEGFTQIAATMRKIIIAEARHRDRYLSLLENIRTDKVFKKDEPVQWICRNCGYVHEAVKAPGVCPICQVKTEYFELEAANY